MTGRKLFERTKFITNILVKLLSFLPESVLKIFYELSINIPGLIGVGIRYILLRNLVKICGENISINRGVIMKGFSNISLGNNVSIHSMCYIDGSGGLIIKNNVSIAHSSSILTTNHSWSNLTIPIKYNDVNYGKVIINDDVWVGCGCRILSGNTIRSRAIIAAGSVVVNDVESNTIVGGVPAKKIKDI